MPNQKGASFFSPGVRAAVHFRLPKITFLAFIKLPLSDHPGRLAKARWARSAQFLQPSFARAFRDNLPYLPALE
jgi:hypothetical protein